MVLSNNISSNCLSWLQGYGKNIQGILGATHIGGLKFIHVSLTHTKASFFRNVQRINDCTVHQSKLNLKN